jgi:hypothetical protein
MGIAPSQTVLLGIQPAEVETGLELSAPLKENFEKILNAALDRLREWGVAITERTGKEDARVPGRPV